MSGVDIVEFAEKFMNVELQDWQKNHLRMLDEMRKDGRICVAMPKNAGRRQVYIYMDQYKELMNNGSPNHS